MYSSGEPVLEQMRLDVAEPLVRNAVEKAEHLPADTLAEVQELAVRPLPFLRVVTMPTCDNSSM